MSLKLNMGFIFSRNRSRLDFLADAGFITTLGLATISMDPSLTVILLILFSSSNSLLRAFELVDGSFGNRSKQAE